MKSTGDEAVEQTLSQLVQMTHALPGTFSAEASLSYFAGVVDSKRWSCEVEADILGQQFTVWGSSPQQVIELAIAEAWRRVPNGTNADLELEPEWYWRDAWVLASVLLAARDATADLADALGATRRASTPAVFINRDEFGFAASRLITSGLLAEADRSFTPSTVTRQMWSAATTDHPTLAGAGFTRSLLRVMQTAGAAANGDVRAWAISDAEYLGAIRLHIDRALG